MFLHVLTDVELKFVVVGVPHQWPFQLATVGPQSVRTRVPQKVWSYRPLLLCPVSLYLFIFFYNRYMYVPLFIWR